jgi:hypothetical protein
MTTRSACIDVLLEQPVSGRSNRKRPAAVISLSELPAAPKVPVGMICAVAPDARCGFPGGHDR